VQKINSALAQGQNLILTPGIYNLDRTIEVKRPDTVVLGLGFPTLVPSNGGVAMEVADVPGVKLNGLLFDAGALSSPVLLQVGKPNAQKSNPQDPTLVSDVFFRIGGATAGKATVSLVVNSDNDCRQSGYSGHCGELPLRLEKERIGETERIGSSRIHYTELRRAGQKLHNSLCNA